MSGWTAGPWAPVPAADGKGDFGIIADGHGGFPRVVIGEVFSSVDFDGQRAQVTPANARLIAAAPDLYESLEEALAWMETVESDARLPHQFDSAPIAQARAALSRVKG